MSPVAIACIGIFIGELYGNFVGGGSIVTQFFLQNLLGMDIKTAIALDNGAVLGSEIGLFVMLLRHQRPSITYIPFIVSVLVGSIAGAWLLHSIPVLYLKLIFAIILVLVVLKSFVSSRMKTTEERLHIAQDHIVPLVCFGLFLGAYNAFLSIGDFIVGLFGLIFLFHLSYQRALFLLSLALVFGRGLALHQYIAYGYLDRTFWLPMFFSAMAAGLTAGYLVTRVETKHIKPVLQILGVVLAGYIIWSFF